MLLRFISVFCILYTSSVWSAATVRLNDVDTPIVQASRASTYTLIVDSPSGDGTSKTAPASVFVPIEASGGSTDNRPYSTYANNVDNVLIAGGDGEGSLIFSLDLNEDGENVDFFIGVEESDGKFSIVDNVTLAPTQGDNVTVSVELNDICNADSNGSNTLDCANKFLESDDPVSQKSVILYFFYGTPGLTGSGNDLSGVNTGIYYDLHLSNKIYSSTITLSSLVKGDSQLTAIYSGPTLTDFYQVNAFDYTAAGHEDETYSTAVTAGGTNYVLDSTTTIGEAKIKNLNNDQTYNFSIYFTDKYKFATLFSNDETGTPQEIEALLKSNQCFLLTAGFNGNHPVIDYFRKVRDEVLANNPIGRFFIKTYYKLGPKLAPLIIENPFLAKMVRGVAKSAYWLMEGDVHPLQVTEKGPKTQNSLKK